MSTSEIESKCRELKQWLNLIEEAEAEAETIKAELKTYMDNCEELRAGEYKITYKSVTSSRIDTTSLKKLLPDIAQQFTKTTTTKRFTLA